MSDVAFELEQFLVDGEASDCRHREMDMYEHESYVLTILDVGDYLLAEHYELAMTNTENFDRAENSALEVVDIADLDQVADFGSVENDIVEPDRRHMLTDC